MLQIVKCPYCLTDSKIRDNKKFVNWEEVNNHVKNCNLNNKTYIIFKEYGPLKVSYINSFNSIGHFKQEYPNIKCSTYMWKYYRNNYGLTLSKGPTWTKDKVIDKILEVYKNLGKTPTAAEIRNIENFPSVTTVQTLFGSWNNAIIAAKLDTNYGNQFGIPTKGIDNRLYRSRAEAYFVDNYLYNKYVYEYEPKYGNGWYYDFYLPEKDLYIEIDGNCRPDRIKEKVEFNFNKNINCLIISTEDMYEGRIKI